MALGPRLDLRQSQSLVMTPQLQQAIKLLALSNLEVEAVIAEAIEDNPLLDDGRSSDVDSDEGSPSDNEVPIEPETADRLLEFGDGAADAPLDVDYVNETFHHDGPTDSIQDQPEPSHEGPGLDGSLGFDGGGEGSGEAFDFDTLSSASLSLHEHLVAQAGESLSGAELAVAMDLIGQIDEAGYLSADLLDVATRLGVPLGLVNAVLAHVQTFDPAGVAARDLAECLAIQAKEADRYDPCMARLIAHLDLVAKGALPQLKRICNVDDEDLMDMIRELRAYDPKPGLRFGSDTSTGVVPDIFVAERGTGWAVEINSATLPRLLVNKSYYVELSGGAQDAASKAWLNEKLADANWLIKALDQRQRTIVKVTTELVKQQEAFFRNGVAHLKPLTLRTIADAIGMHESTISRVTSNKYLSCSRGLYELKYFFTSGVSTADGGDAASSEAVKAEIRALIGAETADDILSDDQLVEMLNAKGFDIARRTVAKYREAIGLGSSVQRRRQKRLAAA